jgi:mRNA-degrading endonuclease RelE of RelBE toxin-antitoxin system
MPKKKSFEFEQVKEELMEDEKRVEEAFLEMKRLLKIVLSNGLKRKISKLVSEIMFLENEEDSLINKGKLREAESVHIYRLRIEKLVTYLREKDEKRIIELLDIIE